MFSPAFVYVCLFVSGIRQKLLSTDFHKIQRKGGTYMGRVKTVSWW